MKKIISMVLAVVMLCAVLPVSAFAGYVEDSLTDANFTVIDNDQSTLAPGVTMNELVLHNSRNERVEMYVTTVDTTLDTVKVMANYMDNQNAVFGMQTLSAQVAALEAKKPEPFKIVAGINASYYNVTTGQPTGAFVMEGIDASASGDSYSFFAVLKDGTYMIGAKGEYSKYKSQIQEAIGGWIHLVKDGKVQSGLDKTTLYPRQTLGLTADGKLIIMTADGSQAPVTVGITIQEQAEIMQSLGCVEAIHLDRRAVYAIELVAVLALDNKAVFFIVCDLCCAKWNELAQHRQRVNVNLILKAIISALDLCLHLIALPEEPIRDL